MFDENIKRKRITNEQLRLQKSKLGFAQIYPNSDNPMEFHFLLKGHDDSEYKGGYYIGKIKIDKDYPAKAGDFMMLTPSGRFDVNKNICLSNSAYHQNEHTPLWSIENMVVGMASIFHEEDHDAKGNPKHSISHRYDSKDVRKMYASQSLSYNMTNYPNLFPKFNQLIDEHGFPKTQELEVKPKVVTQTIVEPIVTQPIVEPIVTQPIVEPIVTQPIVEPIVTQPIVEPIVTTNKTKPKKNTIQKISEMLIPKKKTTKQINTKAFDEERQNKIKENLEQIKNMPIEKFDIKPYQEVTQLMSPISFTEL